MRPGIFTDIDIKDYHSDKEWYSASGLKLAKKSLKLFKMYLDGQLEKTNVSHFDFGNAFELALLSPNEFNEKVLVEDEIYNRIFLSNPETKSPRSTNIYKEWKENQKDKYVVPIDGAYCFETIQKMLESCYQDETIQRLIKNIEYNYSLCWIDEETGLQLKTRPDICQSKKNIIVNLKTAADGSPEKFFKDCANFDYPFQACMEIDGVLKTGMMPQVDYYFWLVVEKDAPYSAQLYEFSQEDIAWNMITYRKVLRNVSEAKKQNKYPSYSQRAVDNAHGIIQVNLPLWYKNMDL